VKKFIFKAQLHPIAFKASSMFSTKLFSLSAETACYLNVEDHLLIFTAMKT